jgi:cytochrome c oxidase subunit II
MEPQMFVQRFSLLIFAVFVLPDLALQNTQATQSPSQGATPAREIQMTAKKYAFSPNPIRVKKGEHVRLIITATDRDHGFKLEAFNIEQRLKKGVPITVEFTADKAGTFPFKCFVHCGFGHSGMKGTLIVEE